MKKIIHSSRFWLCVALCICLISMIGSSTAQRSGGKVKVQNVTFIGEAGNTVAGKLYIPSTASAGSPAPAIVTVHGWYNNREMQDCYSTEFARRGYVVLATDMYGHGDSEWKTWEELYVDGCGEYSAVQFLASLPYVDTTRIGVTGHSSGGDMMAQAVAIDNEHDQQLIAACLFQASYLNDDAGVNHAGDFGSRDVGIIADRYDEFFYVTSSDSEGTEGAVAGSMESGSTSSPARDFIKSNDAKNFLNWNEGSNGFDGTPEPGKFYTRTVDGEESVRVIFTPNMTHPRVAFSSECVGNAVDFFEAALGAPNPISSSDQTWHTKAFFNLIGLLAFLSLFALIPMELVETRFFSSLKAEKPVEALVLPDKKTKLWFWLSLLACAIFGLLTFPVILGAVTTKETVIAFWPQTSSLAQGLWALACGVFAAILLFVFYHSVGKKNGLNLRERGVIMSASKLGKTLLLVLVTLYLAFSVLWFADYFFLTDFRFYLLNFRVFKAADAGIILHFIPFFAAYYVINSISTNAINFTKLGKSEKEWLNLLVICVANALGMLIYLALQYGVQRQTGTLLFHSNLGQGISGIWAYATAFLLLVTPLLSRAVYKKTANPYIAGLLNGIVVTVFVVTQNATILGS